MSVLAYTGVALATEYKVAVQAHNSISQALAQWQPTIDFLNEQMPTHHFELVPVTSLKTLNQKAIEGIYDFVLTNPASFVTINQMTAAKAMVALVNKGAGRSLTRFGSVIFVDIRWSSDILKLSDINGRALMAVSESDFGGWQMAWFELLKDSIDPYRDLSRLEFAAGIEVSGVKASGIEERVVDAVAKGEVDVGVVRTGQLERMAMAGKIDLRYFRILNNKNVPDFPFFLSTALYPEWVFAAMLPIDPAVQKDFRRVLHEITSESKAAQSGKYMAWSEPADYGSVEGLLSALGLSGG